MSKKWRRAGLGLAFVLLACAALPTFRQWLELRRIGLWRVDYALYYASAIQGLQEGWHTLYDLDTQRAVYARISPDLWWFPNVYTPALSLVVVPLTLLPLPAGYVLWSLLLLSSLLLSWNWLAPGDRPLRGVQLAMLFVPYPVALGLILGQVVVLQVGAVALCFVLLRQGRERAAGAVLSVIALKPQGLFLVPFALLAAGKRATFATWALCMAAIGACVLAFIGPDAAAAYLHRLLDAQAHPEAYWVAWSYTLTRRFEGPSRIAVQLAVVAAVLAAAWRNRERTEVPIAAGVVGSLLATPFLHLNDLILLFPAGWLTVRAFPSRQVAAPLLAGYVLLCLCTPSSPWARWVLLFECLWLLALAALPRRWFLAPRGVYKPSREPA